MSVTEKLKAMANFFQPRQQPGESYAQFAMVLQAILEETTGTCAYRAAHQGSEYFLYNPGKSQSPTNPPPFSLRPITNQEIPRLGTPGLLEPHETKRMYTLNSGNCPVIKVSIGARTRKFLADTGAAISIVEPEIIPLRLRNQIVQKQAVLMEVINGSAFKVKV
ncbi:hypothetical protein ACTXT7_006085 [Hymenolepis weldensis]